MFKKLLTIAILCFSSIYLSSCVLQNKPRTDDVILFHSLPHDSDFNPAAVGFSLALKHSQLGQNSASYLIATGQQQYDLYHCDFRLSKVNMAYYPFNRRNCVQYPIILKPVLQDDHIVAKINIDKDKLSLIDRAKNLLIPDKKELDHILDKLLITIKLTQEKARLNYLVSDFTTHYAYSLLPNNSERLKLIKEVGKFKEVSFESLQKLTSGQYLLTKVNMLTNQGSTTASIRCDYAWRESVADYQAAQSLCRESSAEMKEMLVNMMKLTPAELKNKIERLKLFLTDAH